MGDHEERGKRKRRGRETILYLTCHGDASWWPKSTVQGATAVRPGFCSWAAALGRGGLQGRGHGCRGALLQGRCRGAWCMVQGQLALRRTGEALALGLLGGTAAIPSYA
jgi:hypothetical protein